MDYYINRILELKEEEMPIKELTTITNDIPSHKTTGEDQWEDKEEGTDNNTTPQMPLFPWTMSLYQWTYPEVAHQLTGEDEVAKEDGVKEDIKEE